MRLPAILTIIVLGLIVVLCTGCGVRMSATQTDIPNFKIEKIFTHEGCTIYRFRDRSYFRYFSKCVNAESQTWWNERHGKTDVEQMI